MDFDDILGTTKDERIRAWSVEQAIKMGRASGFANGIIKDAKKIENYVLGKNEGNDK